MARDKPFREFIASNEASRHESKTQAAVPDFRHVGTPKPGVFNYTYVLLISSTVPC